MKMMDTAPNTHRRRLSRPMAMSLVGGAVSLPWIAQAQQDVVTLMVGFPPGGATDYLARLVAEGLRKQLGALVLVDNKAGAGGQMGAALVKNAKPTGRRTGFQIAA